MIWAIWSGFAFTVGILTVFAFCTEGWTLVEVPGRYLTEFWGQDYAYGADFAPAILCVVLA